MGEALIAGTIKGGLAPENIIVCENNAERAFELTKRYDILAAEIDEAVESADYVFIAVRPKDVKAVLQGLSEVAPNLDNELVVVSIAAGISCLRGPLLSALCLTLLCWWGRVYVLCLRGAMHAQSTWKRSAGY